MNDDQVTGGTWSEGLIEARLVEHQRMYAALLEIKRLYSEASGGYLDQSDDWPKPREIWSIACRGLGK